MRRMGAIYFHLRILLLLVNFTRDTLAPLHYIFKADFVLFIASFLSECLCLSKLVFYEEQRSWNEAYSICSKNGGFLATIDSQDKYNILSTFSSQAPWNSINKVDKLPLWIGLHVTDSGGIVKEWADCSQSSWTNWHPSQPSLANVNRCVYLQKLTAKFWMGVCNALHYFICENIDANPCNLAISSCYEATLGITGQVVQSNTDTNPLTTCNNGVTTSPSTANNGVTTSPSTANNGVTTSPSTANNGVTTSPSTANNGVTTSPSTAAGSSEQSTVITTETSSVHLTTNSLQQVTSSNIATGAQYFTTEKSSTSISMTNSVNTSTALNNTLAYTTISVAECICTCVDDGANLTESELLNKIETRKRDLEVNKASLSSSIRKKESANDSRTSSKGIGYVGVTFITFIVGGIVLMDLHHLYMFIVEKYCATKSSQE